jgi:hypothetical protein
VIPKTALRSALALVATLLLSISANAQQFRSYLAVDGNDANPCTLAAPCRLLPAALAAVADGGEIWMLDSANYNSATVNVTKSVTILAIPGALGSVVAINGPAIRVATAGVKLALRNLVIVPLPNAGAVHGINMTAGAALTVDNCLIANMPTNGITVSTAAAVRITDTTIRDNLLHGVVLQNGAHATITRATISGNANVGVFAYMTAAGPATLVDIADSTLSGNNAGFTAFTDVVANEIYASISGSRIFQNAANGVSANGGPLGTVFVSATNNTISHNAVVGVVAYNAGGKVWVSGNTVNQNEKGIWAAVGVIESAGNNTVRDNTVDTDGTITVFGMK